MAPSRDRTSAARRAISAPRPPVGNPAHSYHFQVFALDTVLDLPPGASRETVLDVMRGHVLSVGEVVGTYQRPAGTAAN